MDMQDIEKLAEVFKAVGHPVRLKIVMGLMEKDHCNVSTMVEKLNISQPNVSQHLNILKNAGIVEGYRQGNMICYKLINEKIKRILNCINDYSCEG